MFESILNLFIRNPYKDTVAKIKPKCRFEEYNKGCMNCSWFSIDNSECSIPIKEFEEIINAEINLTIYDESSIRNICKKVFGEGRLTMIDICGSKYHSFNISQSRKYFETVYKNVPKDLYIAMCDYLHYFCDNCILKSVSLTGTWGHLNFYEYCSSLGMDVDFYVEYNMRKLVSNNDKIHLPIIKYNKDNNCIFFKLNKIGINFDD